MPSLYQRHAQTWKNCERCGLCKGRQNVVLARGTVPCDIVFIGEAPGESEDAIGTPFIGPAGKLLDYIIQRGIVHTRQKNEDVGAIGDTSVPEYSYAITNLVCCIPRDTSTGGKAAQPDPDEIKACQPRLIEFVRIADPRLIIAVGTLAKDWLDPKTRHHLVFHKEIPHISIDHPAYVLRLNVAMRGLAVQRATVNVQNAVDEYLSTPTT